ncbi:MAG: hypothetical protein J5644_11165 [Bacteroidales bacterium]|nr:hypothetical protein [Bacteroidales bacterium]
MKKIILLISIFTATLTMAAQDGITLHFMRLNPYSAYSNPSAHLQYRGYVGMPAVSNINVALTNTSIQYKTLFGTNEEGTVTTLKLNDFVDRLSKKKNLLNTNVSLNLIDFGFRTKPIRFAFSYRLRIDEYFSYNKDLFALPVHGNMSYVGENHPAQPDVKINVTAYQEIALGMQAEIHDRIYIGVRPKLLFGLANVKTRKMSATLYTDPEDYTMRLNYNLDASLASVIPYSVTKDSSGKTSIQIDPKGFLNNWQNAFGNVGAGLDLGFTYRINNMFGLSASFLDLGFIRWKTNCGNITGAIAETETSTYYDDGSFIFSGLSEEDIKQLREDPEAFKDKILEYFPITYTQKKAYTQALASRFIVEGYCNLGKYHRFTALFQGRIVSNQFIPSFTVAWNGTFLNTFDLCVSYTLSQNSYANLGLGIGLNLGVFHLYAATDNIFGICNSKSPQRSLLNARNANIQMGIVFDWGKLHENKLEKKSKQKND